jgi:hypothetical protein
MFAQEKPSDEQLAALVRQAVAGMHGTNDPIAMAGGLNRIGNPVVAELRTFKLVRWGEPRPD